MAPEEVEKPEEVKAETPKAKAPKAAEAPAAEAPAADAATATAEPAAAAVPPADPVKQMGDAAHQASASLDKSLSTMTPESRFLMVLILSILIGGWLGAILNGQVMKGIVILALAFVLFFVAIITFGFGLILVAGLHIVAVIDAIIIANRKQKGETFGDWDFFWKPAPPAA